MYRHFNGGVGPTRATLLHFFLSYTPEAAFYLLYKLYTDYSKKYNEYI